MADIMEQAAVVTMAGVAIMDCSIASPEWNACRMTKQLIGNVHRSTHLRIVLARRGRVFVRRSTVNSIIAGLLTMLGDM